MKTVTIITVVNSMEVAVGMDETSTTLTKVEVKTCIIMILIIKINNSIINNMVSQIVLNIF